MGTMGTGKGRLERERGTRRVKVKDGGRGGRDGRERGVGRGEKPSGLLGKRRRKRSAMVGERGTRIPD